MSCFIDDLHVPASYVSKNPCAHEECIEDITNAILESWRLKIHKGPVKSQHMCPLTLFKRQEYS